MNRRELLRSAGASAALALFPAQTRSAWDRATTSGWSGALTAEQLALVSNISDAVIPRTDTPGALDVHVPAFVNALVSESWAASELTAFQGGLDALAVRFGSASGDALPRAIAAIESEQSRRSEPQRTYWELKSIIVHGYFTSEPVMKEVLRVEIMPGRFDGAAPVLPRRAPSRPAEGRGHA